MFQGMRVEEFPGIGRVMVSPMKCDRCGAIEKLEPIEIALCARGDEIDGCRVLAMRVTREPGWFHRMTAPRLIQEDYCAACAPYVQGGEAES